MVVGVAVRLGVAKEAMVGLKVTTQVARVAEAAQVRTMAAEAMVARSTSHHNRRNQRQVCTH